ncbi:hypothetical protein BJ875DRAFT_250808 [Amylocarpus encephaloides]|uniref:Uncharacterized protein n=1 Tax=Amylocarpus encephaloides TaxID=45428 RepID=A0A9P7YLT4_9HELO|nr:hypothetical protein BJ875DRAFT_250808 [Amylocarpus encephaloides]
MASYHSHAPKPRTKVKPILKKFTQSEKSSLDLDRLAAEQDGFSGGVGLYEYNYGTGARSGIGSSHDVIFTNGRRGYHNRSTSGTSQFSTATTGSAHRAGSFVHPFQQTPRPYTPPIAASCQNSLRESDHSHSHSDSPALTEDEDSRRPTNIRNNSSNKSASLTGSAAPIVTQHPPLRIQTKPSSSRLAFAASTTSLNNSVSLNPDYASPVETMSPSSLRTSIDKGFRIRSRSEVDTRPRQETIQEARRKFEEKEQAKEEKAAREEVRAMEKRNQKEAREVERRHRRSSASDGGARAKRSKSDITRNNEKASGVFARDYNSAPAQNAPYMAERYDEASGRPKKESTKKKTHSAWTKLVMWLRTRFIRMGRKKA